MKKVLSVLLSVILVITALPLGAFSFTVSADTTEDGLTYVIENDKITITDYDWSASEVYIPENINGFPVVAISSDAFTYCGDFPLGYSGVKELHIPSTIITIENIGTFSSNEITVESIIVDEENPYFSSYEGALYNKDKTELLKCPSKKSAFVAPDGLKNLACKAFQSATNLKNISLPDSVVNINCDFYDTQYYQNSDNWENNVLYISNHLIKANTNVPSSYTVKDGTVSIGASAFSETSIETIILPESVHCIGDYVFNACEYLENITISGTIDYMGYNAFDGTPFYDNEENWDNDVLYVANHLIAAKSSLSGDYEVKAGTISIVDKAFNWSQLDSITLCDGIVKIGAKAFASCWYLTKINIPKSVLEIGENAFENTFRLEEINVDSKNSTYLSESGILYNKEKTILIKVPQGYKSDIYYIPETVEIIEEEAICDCESLNVIIFPDANLQIGEYALAYSYALEVMYIPNELSTLNDDILYNQNIKHILYSGTEAEWVASGYSELSAFSSATICYSATPDDFVLTHKAAPECGGSDYNYYECTICGNEFKYGWVRKEHDMVVTEEFEAGCEIGKAAKYKCSECDYFYYEDDLNGTGHNFVDEVCTKCGTEEDWVYRLTAHNGVGYEGIVIYDYVGSDPNPTVPETIEGYPVYQISHLSFSYNTNVVSVKIPEKVTSIAYSAFKNASNLSAVSIPKDIKSISFSTFEGCENLNHIYYSGTEEEWNNIDKEEYGNEYISNATVHFNSSEEDFEVVTLSPQTCTKGGSYKLACELCGDVWYSQTTPLGHKKGELIGEDTPTCKTPSNLLYDCVRCDYVIKEPSTNFKEHIFVDGSCTDCGMLQSDCIESKHYYKAYEDESWTINKPGAKEILITFSGEFNCQALRIYDKDDNFIAYGNFDSYYSLAGKTITVPGDTARISIEYSEWNEYYGFKVQYLKAVYDNNGDINNDNTASLEDVVTLAQYVAKWDVKCNKDFVDTSGDGKVDLKDVVHLARYVAKWKGVELH